MMTGIEQSKNHYLSHQQGIALIMVLGILSVTVMLAVAFAISMRTERVAAGNFTDTVRAKHLVRTALHLAMADIYQDLHIVKRETCSVVGSSLSVSNAADYPDGLQIGLHNVTWPQYPIYSAGGMGNTINIKDSGGIIINLAGREGEVGNIIKRENPYGNSYPPWVAITSTNNSTNNPQIPISLTNHIVNFIPSNLISEAIAADTSAQSHYWTYIDTVVNGKTTTIGRVAYLIVNCSGLLDANYAGGTNRANGTDPAEIAIDYLGEINNAADFDSARKSYCASNGPFETMPELAAGLSGKAGLPLSWHPVNFFCYTACLENEWGSNRLDVTSGGLLDISGNAEKLRGIKDDIIVAFRSCGLTNAGEAEQAYINLIDYVDEDSYAGNEWDNLPKDLHTSVEAVPMINEVMIYNSVTVYSNRYDYVNTLEVELWYPFISPSTASFAFELQADVNSDGSASPPPINLSSNIICTPAFQTIVYTYTNSVALDPVSPVIPAAFTWNANIKKATVALNGNIVDQFDYPLLCAITTTITGINNYSQISKECIDPRLNWDPNSTNQWGTWSINASLGSNNLITEQYWADNSVTDKKIEVANRPLQSLMELSYLLCSTNPWTTIDPPTKHKVYEHFRLEWCPVLRGYVNPNTHIVDVLAATFYKAPLTGTNTASSSQAELIAKAIIDSKPIEYGKVRGYRTIDEVVNVLWSSPAITSAFTPAEIQALIDNTVKLLNPRQNLFAIIIEVHLASGGNIPRNPVKERAVGIVWRDPFRDNMYVRSLFFME